MSNADWWAQRLGNATPQQQTRPINQPMPPSQQPMTKYVPPAVNSQISRPVDNCPTCNSTNYMSPASNAAKRCYDCGYPIEQSGSRFGALTGANVEGGVKSSTGNDIQSNWNPQGIIGRIN